MKFAALVGSLLVAAADLTVAQTPSSAASAVVVGTVFDSLTMRGLVGATVQLASTSGQSSSRTAKTDASGNFEFTDVAVGSYLLGFFHPKLDSLGLTSETRQLDIRTAEPLLTRLTIPSGRTIARDVCGASFINESSGLLLGYVRGADNSMPRAGGNVIVRWAELVIDKGSIQRSISTSNTFANATGLFAACGVPTGTPILLHGSAGPESSGQFEITVPSSGLLHRDVFVAPVNQMTVRSLDSVPDVKLLTGNGRIRGQVRGSNRRPIIGAQITLWGTSQQTRTNDDGEFSLGGLPGGTHTLEVRAIGFMPTQMAVDILEGQAGAAEVELAGIAVTLDTVKVTAQRLYASRKLVETERRIRSGMGHILGPEEITKRNPWVLTDLLRTMPGIRVIPNRFGADEVWIRERRGLGFCRPEFIVDNIRMVVDQDFPVNSIVPMSDVLALEVYTNMVPGEFITHTDCGVIAVTTGARPQPEKR